MGNQRKQYLIDKDFQVRFIMKFCMVVFFSSVLIGVLLFVFSQGSTTVAIENTQVVVKRTADFMLPLVVQVVLIVAAAAAMVVLALTLFMSHRIAGPLFRMRREVEALSAGDLTRNFNLRAKDQLQGLAESLRVMASILRQRYGEAHNGLLDIEEYMQQKDFTLTSADKEAFKEKLKAIKDAIHFFRIS